MRLEIPSLLLLTASLIAASCVSRVQERPVRSSGMMVPPRCSGIEVCVLGHVTAAGTTAPVAKATVFLEREQQPGEDQPLRLYALTDELGVFIFEEPAPGNYRLAVYKEDSSVELGGLELGEPGTTLLPIHLAI